MAVDARGDIGQPIFYGSGADDQAADLTLLGEEIYRRGTRLVLTESEMDDLVTAGLAYDGLAVFCTTDKREYVRISGDWVSGNQRHIEFSSSVSIANSTDGTLGALTLDASRSTDTSLVTSPSAGRIRFQPGIYAITLIAEMPAATTGLTLLGLRSVSPSTFIARNNFPTGSSTGLMFSIANYRILNPNTDLDTYFFQTSGATRTVPGRVAITKIG